MSYLSIMLRLSADERTRCHLWKLSLQHTLLINALHEQIQKHKDFNAWQRQGSIPQKELKSLSQAASLQLEVTELPRRFVTSAIASVQQTYMSWFALQKRRYNKLAGKQRWLQIQERDLNLAQTTDFSTAQINSRVQDVLAQVNDQIANEIASQQSQRCQKHRSSQKDKNRKTTRQQDNT